MIDEGLRNAKKRATSHALATAAFELTHERGLDNVSIEDVANRAGVSRRTFANYYSCKEEAVAAVLVLEIEGLGEAELDFRSISETSLLDAAIMVVRREMTADRVKLFRTLDSLTIKHPPLRPYMLSVQDAVRQRTADLLKCDITGTISPAYLFMLVGAMFGALSVALSSVTPVRLPGEPHASHDDIDLDAYIDLVADRLRHGF